MSECHECSHYGSARIGTACDGCHPNFGVTGKPNFMPIITQAAAYALLAALENEIAELARQGVVPSDSTLEAIAAAKGQTDASTPSD